MNRELTNARTKHETGFDYVVNSINIGTPFGKKLIKEKAPFFSGEENLLKEEFQRLNKILEFVKQNPDSVDVLTRLFSEIKDVSFTIMRSSKEVLSVVELFEIKSLLLKMEKISKVLYDAHIVIPEKYILTDITSLLEKLDIRKDRMETFYVYDEFSVTLADARKRKKEIERLVRDGQKEQSELNAILEVIEEQELLVREKLSEEIGAYSEALLENCMKIGELDIAIAKTAYALKTKCVLPEIIDEHIIEIEDGRHLKVYDILAEKGKEYCPVSIALSDGVTCITGANMGGKTVSIKLVGLIQLLVQNAFFVPCKRAAVGLSNYVQILIGDNQSLERGLSSFGSEMEVLKEILERGEDKSLFLIDEIASGTNPKEGFALTKSIVEHMKKKPYISLITTHFDNIAGDDGVNNLQVAGLSEVDFEKLDKEIREADKNERIDIIAKYMDYRLHKVTKDKKVQADAINIARILGISEEIIENAKKYL